MPKNGAFFFVEGARILPVEVDRMAAWELLGAVVGAGLASGREVASFFVQYGMWGFAGVASAVGTLYLLSDSKPRGPLWRMLLSLLLIATGGAMLSGAGHIAALTLPVRGASLIGGALTLALALFLSRRTATGLMWGSRGMMAAMLVLILAGMTLPPMRAVRVEAVPPWEGLLRGVTYGGFNAALMLPLMPRARRRDVGTACILIALLLGLGCAVLLRHPALIGETMPYVQLASRFGKWGYALSAGCMYLAVLSTLMACLRGVQGIWPVLAMAGVSLLGFDGAVDTLYPLLGGGCFLCMLGSKCRKITKLSR